ncbi:MAG: tetratricopeptide repeat protein [Ignavibacteriae bacterium]|nr:tetratricopeptide repeat protein [Ignavibacteriota bacterium]MCB9216849.1 tetratricopeptide repeat protein [Ignavibacteria bacterium]
MPQANELRLFISSTFRDLGEEREYLVKKIFPEIRALCREKGITFTEVDLRWGLTDQDVKLGQVIRACLEEVDKCRPYFIGITGSRYGYVPSYLDILKDPTLLEQYLWIEDAATEGMSITEMETHYALLGAGSDLIDKKPAEKAYFYFRRQQQDVEGDSDESEELRKLQEYQERIEASGAPIETFSDPPALGRMIYDDLVRIIQEDFADASPPTPLEEERSRHIAFALSRRRAYIPNPLYLKSLNDHVREEGPPLVVYAESGSGKSSLFAYWGESFRKKNPQIQVIEHYVGIGATGTDHYGVIRHLCMEIKERFNREEELPTAPEELDQALSQWFGYAGHALKQSGERMVVILDGLNQLQGKALELQWIPEVISPHIRLILSSTVEGTLLELKRRGWNQLGMQALTKAERETIVVRYLAEFRKALHPDQIQQIASDYKCGHPLFLKTLLEEIRLISRHEDLQERIDEYLTATGTEDLFQKVLERIEEDHGSPAVQESLSALWCSRTGLSEGELSELSGFSRLKITAMTAGLDYHLVRKNGYLTFFHDYLRRSVEKRYLGSEERRRTMYLRLAEYFEQGELSRRSATERVWGYADAGKDSKVVEALMEEPLLRELYTESGKYEVLSLWKELRDKGNNPEALYLERLSREVDEGKKSHPLDYLKVVGDILEHLSHWSGALEVYGQILKIADEAKQLPERADALLLRGRLLTMRGSDAEAMEHFSEALSHYEKLQDRRGAAFAVGHMGHTQRRRGEHERALELYQQAFAICEETGDLVWKAAIGVSMGVVHFERGEYDSALEAYQQALTICERLGERKGIAAAVVNIGNIYAVRGDYDRALKAYQQQLALSEEVGDQWWIAKAVRDIGLVYFARGEYGRALEACQRALAICEKLGEQLGIAGINRDLGNIYLKRKEYDRALESYEKALEIFRALESKNHFASLLQSRANLLLTLCELDTMPSFLPRFLPEAENQDWKELCIRAARNNVQESIEITKDNSLNSMTFAVGVLLARIEYAERKTDTALKRLQGMLQDAGDEEQQADLHYWLWKLGNDRQASTARDLYTTLITRIPRHDFTERLDELNKSLRERERRSPGAMDVGTV